ncbi:MULTISPECIES: chromate efflux transporter [Rhodobacterales]|uniref:chromate efflux transporter n=1 Tax=Rhodobacterales TaxID=204455 RepID=UPI0015F0E769|nr:MULTISPECIES: chromate efflux transporter [Rhodobacterales]MDO6590755.1 chromate efflux transporter [Yoonia sp. 1_MG-2023]
MTAELIRVFGRIGFLSFGGPAAQIALMHKELVEDRPWLSEDEYLKALSFCMLLPGPEAMQLATYAGWKRGGIVGGLIGGGLFVIPGALLIMLLALAYGTYGNLAVIQALFLGVKACVVVIVVQALIKVAKRALARPMHRVIAIGAFIALFLFSMPFPLVVLCAGFIGTISRPKAKATAVGTLPSITRTLRTIGIGCAIWVAPLIILAAAHQQFLLEIGLFFSKLAVVTFGGAYAVLAYMTQEVVVSYQWLSTQQMMDALGLAETTPGPLILVTQFVGMIAGLAQGGIGLALLAGMLTLWVTFVPCFIWIFAGAPMIDWLDSRPRLRGALSAITAAVVGVIANLSIWFAIHVFFDRVGTVHWGAITVVSPESSTLQPAAVLLASLAAILLLWRNWSLPLVLAITAFAGLFTLAN